MAFGAGGMPLPAEAAAVADARLWSAIQQRDGGQRGNQAKRFLDPERSNDLPDEVALIAEDSMAEVASGTTTPGPSDPIATSAPAASRRGASRGSLSGAFAAWLQGFPQAHLNCAPSSSPKGKRGAQTKSKATATP